MKSFLANFQTKELLRFLVAGSCSVITDALVYWFLGEVGWNVSVAKLISFISGSIVGFVINKLWTFESKGQLHTEMLKYVLLYTTTIVLNVWSNHLVLDLTGLWWFAFLFATGLSTVCNFLGMKFFVFHKRVTR